MHGRRAHARHPPPVSQPGFVIEDFAEGFPQFAGGCWAELAVQHAGRVRGIVLEERENDLHGLPPKRDRDFDFVARPLAHPSLRLLSPSMMRLP